MLIEILIQIILSYVLLCKTMDSLTTMAAAVANKEFTYTIPTSVIWCKTDSNNINQFNRLYNGLVMSVFVQELTTRDPHTQSALIYEQTVLYVVNIVEFNTFLKILQKLTIKPIRMILIIMSQTEQNIKVTDYTKTAWQYDMADIIIINNNERNETIVNTFIPYSNKKCGDYTPVALNLNKSRLFTRKFNNFYQCPIKVIGYALPPYAIVQQENNTAKAFTGIDVDFINFVLDKINATMIVTSSSVMNKRRTGVHVPLVNKTSMYRLANKTLLPSFNELISGLADILVPAVIINEEKYLNAQMSLALGNINIVWCVPKRREIFIWAKILLPFLSYTTGFIVLSFVLFIIVNKVIFRYDKLAKKRNDTIIKSIALFLGQEFKFETDFWFNNLVHMTWIWYCFIVRIVYQGILINSLHQTILEPPIRSLNEALPYFDEIVGVSVILHMYKNTSIAKRYKVLKSNDFLVYLQKIANGEKILQAVNKDLIWYTRYKVQILEENVTEFPVCFFMRPRWSAAKEINRLITWSIEFGFRKQKSQLYLEKWLRSGASLNENNTIDSLTMLTLISCFYGLIGLYIVSFAIFCLEIVWFKFAKK